MQNRKSQRGRNPVPPAGSTIRSRNKEITLGYPFPAFLTGLFKGVLSENSHVSYLRQ